MEHLKSILYVVAGLVIYDKLVKGMLEKKDDKKGTLESAEDIYE
jgi:hypothetical protein